MLESTLVVDNDSVHILVQHCFTIRTKMWGWQCTATTLCVCQPMMATVFSNPNTQQKTWEHFGFRDSDVKSLLLLNRVFRVGTDQTGKYLDIEPDLRHAPLIISESGCLNLSGCSSLAVSDPLLPTWMPLMLFSSCWVFSEVTARYVRMSNRHLLIISVPGFHRHISCTSLNSSSFSLALSQRFFLCMHSSLLFQSRFSQ